MTEAEQGWYTLLGQLVRMQGIADENHINQHLSDDQTIKLRQIRTACRQLERDMRREGRKPIMRGK